MVKIKFRLWVLIVLQVIIGACFFGVSKVNAVPPYPQDLKDVSDFVIEGVVGKINCGEQYDASGCDEKFIEENWNEEFNPIMVSECTANLEVKHIIKGDKYEIGDKVSISFKNKVSGKHECVIPGEPKHKIMQNDTIRINDEVLGFHNVIYCSSAAGVDYTNSINCGDGVCDEGNYMENYCTCPEDCGKDYIEPKPEPKPEPKSDPDPESETLDKEEELDDIDQNEKLEDQSKNDKSSCLEIGNIDLPSNRYCGQDKIWKDQKSEEVECQNNYECISLNCKNGKCVKDNTTVDIDEDFDWQKLIIIVLLVILAIFSISSLILILKQKKNANK